MVDVNSMSSAQVEWNMANLLNIELAKLRSNANSYFIQGKYREAIDSLIVMKMTGIHAFTEKERQQLNAIERRMMMAITHLSSVASFNPLERNKAVNDIALIRLNFPLYNEILMDCLHRHGFLGSYKRDSGRMNI